MVPDIFFFYIPFIPTPKLPLLFVPLLLCPLRTSLNILPHCSSLLFVALIRVPILSDLVSCSVCSPAFPDCPVSQENWSLWSFFAASFFLFSNENELFLGTVPIRHMTYREILKHPQILQTLIFLFQKLLDFSIVRREKTKLSCLKWKS